MTCNSTGQILYIINKNRPAKITSLFQYFILVLYYTITPSDLDLEAFSLAAFSLITAWAAASLAIGTR